VISGKTASPSISQTLRHYWVSAICDAVVLERGIFISRKPSVKPASASYTNPAPARPGARVPSSGMLTYFVAGGYQVRRHPRQSPHTDVERRVQSRSRERVLATSRNRSGLAGPASPRGLFLARPTAVQDHHSLRRSSKRSAELQGNEIAHKSVRTAMAASGWVARTGMVGS